MIYNANIFSHPSSHFSFFLNVTFYSTGVRRKPREKQQVYKHVVMWRHQLPMFRLVRKSVLLWNSLPWIIYKSSLVSFVILGVSWLCKSRVLNLKGENCKLEGFWWLFRVMACSTFRKIQIFYYDKFSCHLMDYFSSFIVEVANLRGWWYLGAVPYSKMTHYVELLIVTVYTI